MLDFISCFGIEIHFELAKSCVGFFLNGFLPGFKVVFSVNGKLLFSGLYICCHLHSFLSPGVLQDFICLWDEVVFYRFLGHHFDDGGLEVSAQGVDPSIDPRVKFVKVSGQCYRVGCLACDVGDKTVDEQRTLGLSPGFKVCDGLADGLISQGVSECSGFQSVGEHNVSDIGRRGWEINGLDTSYTECPEGIVLVLTRSLAEIAERSSYVVDASHGVKFVRGKVAEGIWEVLVGGGKLHGVEALMYGSQGFHNHAEPGRSVKNTVWGVVG